MKSGSYVRQDSPLNPLPTAFVGRLTTAGAGQRVVAIDAVPAATNPQQPFYCITRADSGAGIGCATTLVWAQRDCFATVTIPVPFAGFAYDVAAKL